MRKISPIYARAPMNTPKIRLIFLNLIRFIRIKSEVAMIAMIQKEVIGKPL
jgi:hypothetical protein